VVGGHDGDGVQIIIGCADTLLTRHAIGTNLSGAVAFSNTLICF
jgi:hypothetical protein